MKMLHPRFIGLFFSVLLLSACMGPKTPQEVTQAFWDAVINNRAEDVVEYSTLTDARYYDGFSKDWTGFQPSWGKVVIEGNEASIASKFKSPVGSNMDDRQFTTYLVRENETWKVDYEKTAEGLRGGVFSNLFGALSQMGNDLSKQLKSSADDFNAEMERMSKKMEEMSNEYRQQATESIERYSDDLQKQIQELEESINRALEDKDNNLSDEDRQILEEVSADLKQDRENLSDPTVESVSEGSKGIGDAQVKLESLDNDELSKYQEQWSEIGKQFQRDMQEMLDALSASGRE